MAVTRRSSFLAVILNGSTGADVLRLLDSADGTDTISNFVATEDTIGMVASGFSGSLLASAGLTAPQLYNEVRLALPACVKPFVRR